MNQQIQSRQFLEAIRQPLAEGDANALAHAVRVRWTPRQVCRLLRDEDADVRRAAAVTLGMIGDRSVVQCLARALHDPDQQVNQMAEHGLWSIWFRAGSPQACRPFSEGIAYLADEQYGKAIRCFEHAVRIDPSFAEGFNQCAIAHFFLCEWDQSIADSQRALDRMPMHFGAIAGMGHSYTHLGDLDKALWCYRRAIRLNPRMPAISAAICRIEESQRRQCDSSGMFDAVGTRY